MVIMYRGSTYHVDWKETDRGWLYHIYHYHPYIEESEWIFSIELPKNVPPDKAQQELDRLFPEYYTVVGKYTLKRRAIVGAWEVHEERFS